VTSKPAPVILICTVFGMALISIVAVPLAGAHLYVEHSAANSTCLGLNSSGAASIDAMEKVLEKSGRRCRIGPRRS
jgi:hypothetical protein